MIAQLIALSVADEGRSGGFQGNLHRFIRASVYNTSIAKLAAQQKNLK